MSSSNAPPINDAKIWDDAKPMEEHPAHIENSTRRRSIDHFSKYTHTVKEDCPPPPNRVVKYRDGFKEYAAEFMGTAILIVFGNGVNCQVVLSSNTGVAPTPKGEYLSISFGWAIGVAIGVWVSGGHINPAVTLAMAVWRGFPFRKVPGYMAAQLLGALVGAALIYANYFHAIDIFEGGRGIRTLSTASLFATYPLAYMTNVSAFFSEFLASAVLLIGVLALVDKKNQLPVGIVPIGLFVLILGIGASLGMETAYAVNPARDLGPRLLTSMVGYGGQVYSFRSQYWLWCPICATFSGAQFGTLFYDLFLYTGDESIVQRFIAYRYPSRLNDEKRREQCEIV